MLSFIDPGALLLGLFLILICLRVPIAVALGLTGMIVIYLTDLGAQMFAPVFFANISKFSLLAIPFFILAGVIMGRAGISDRIIRLVSLIAGPFRGGLAIVTVITAIFWGAVSGSGPATVAALGTILIPGMIRAGYDKGFAAALMPAASGIAIIIPPSIAFIVYGVITGASISKLFAAGVIPGILVGVALIVPTYIISVMRHYGGERWGTLREVWAAFKDAIWGLLAPVIILGGIYGGIFTPTEAAAVGVFYGLLVGAFIYKTLKFQDLVDLLVETGIASAVVMLVVAFAGIFGWAMTTLGVVEKVSALALALTSNEMVLLLIINILLLIAGMLLDAISIMYLILPLLMPVMAYYHWDPVWFGVVMTVNLAIGQITPPVAVNLYVGANIARISMDTISRAVWPFVAAAIVALLVITYIPELSLWLPRLVLK
ncbi:TRAP transporter large permease [Sporolituus thermophilus]|uniref:C4-dicarboxylate transporter, DctM subunit n=1 Tax=Sporolituus thermophilus DSM 23256 TaxID=1123285 RepID=A0A1G7L7A6_9FIRM|nr:TRAP transporter large permease [Sporolituus thermophilus]SDF45442.1 C4-dicarboxylate transporter, DctM subunit [Sporolituus thermophilus DSM 23256]